MDHEIKQAMKQIELPEELHERAVLGIEQAKRKKKKRNRAYKWVLGTAASLMMMGSVYSINDSSITNAAENLIGKVFNIAEQEKYQEEVQKASPDQDGGSYEAQEALLQMNQHLELAKAHLSPEDFEDYSLLIKESMKVNLESLNPAADEKKLETKMLKLRKEIEKYGIYKLTTHTLEEAKAMVNYPINKPTYIPPNYDLLKAEARTEEAHIGENPVVVFQYHQIDGEFNFHIIIKKTDNSQEDDLKFYNRSDSYQLNGYTFEHAYDEGKYHSNMQGMRVSFSEEGYEIIIQADLLTKEEMEEILLSMIDQ